MGVSFIDCDQELERRNGVTVTTIFDIEGEAGFRKRETRLLEEFMGEEMGVVATGGGVVTQDVNRTLLKHKGMVIYLSASVDLLWSRLRYCKNRPLLETKNPKERLRSLFEQRDPLYREVSDIIVNVGKGSALTTVRKIEQALENL